MQNISLKHSLVNKFSAQQIQFTKLLQVPSFEMGKYIEKEIESNPILEAEEKESDDNNEKYSFASFRDSNRSLKSISSEVDDINQSSNLTYNLSLSDRLVNQLELADLTGKEIEIGKYIIGSLDSNGFITHSFDTIVDNLAIFEFIDTNIEEVSKVVKVIQSFDPVGIGATNLTESLIIQLKSKELSTADCDLAIKIINRCFSDLKKNNLKRIISRLSISDTESFRHIIGIIKKLNPSPGKDINSDDTTTKHYVYPDFLLHIDEGRINVTLNRGNIPELKINKNYLKILDDYNANHDPKLEESALFIKKRLEKAKLFIDAVKQRHKTLLLIVNTIVKIQKAFFLSEETTNLKPMNLKVISAQIGLDMSTISRAINNKYIQTEYGIYPLKYFFSNSIELDNGDIISNKTVKNIINEIINTEDKTKPYTDDEIKEILKNRGYNIARRTISKYKRQLNIPVARLRKVI